MPRCLGCVRLLFLGLSTCMLCQRFSELGLQSRSGLVCLVGIFFAFLVCRLPAADVAIVPAVIRDRPS